MYSFPFVCPTVVSATRERKSRDADPAGLQLLVTRIGPSKARSALLDMPITVLQAPAHRLPHLLLSLSPTSAKPYNKIPKKGTSVRVDQSLLSPENSTKPNLRNLRS